MLGAPGSENAYVHDASTGVLNRVLLGSEDTFGAAVAIDGERAVVGAFHADSLGTNAGAAYLYDLGGVAAPQPLEGQDTGAFDRFGWSTAVDGNLVLVGAYAHNDTHGAAYLFDATTGEQSMEIVPGVPADDGYFGRSVAIEGGLALVGAYRDIDAEGVNTGSAYLFDTTTGEQVFRFEPEDGAFSDYFGESVALSEGLAIVGSWGNSEGNLSSGAAYVYDVATGQLVNKLTPIDGRRDQGFGGSVAIDGRYALIGAVGDDANGQLAGAAYLFDAVSGQQLLRITPDDSSAYQNFGFSVALDDGLAVIGAPGHSSSNGAAYVFDVAIPEPTSWLLLSAACLFLAGHRLRVV
ncbi:FG-GAP repeat protein [Pseudobythopirellula maris]|uniref:FG-GAP repeat protein n=1 Tax=Pseudobythopirellula maris TaxID=2527991 RepID=UPI0018D2F7D1|nr:FG-GAP repeat protein [Pseudobythopirellula maris]